MNRRAFLAASTAFAAGCAARRPASPVAPAAAVPRRKFARVFVSAERVIRTVVGLRPYRPSGFVVRGEKLGPKFLVHNYGHGGGGMTLSWGTSELAVELIENANQSIAVLGCGGVGLATARLLQRRGATVTIYARDLPPETTSNISGAQWFPTSVFDENRATTEFTSQFVRAAKLSYRHFQTMLGSYYGVHWVPNYLCANHPPRDSFILGTNSPLRELQPEFRDLPREEHPFDAPYVRQFDSMMIEPPVYLNAVLRDFLLAGGRLVVREFPSTEAVLSLSEAVVVNCTGLGSAKLFGDTELMPIKGQLTVLLPQPEVDYNVLSGSLYMFPRTDGILLGGTFERGQYSLEPDLEAKARILEGHRRFFAAMRVS